MGSSMIVKHLICGACGERIGELEPDIVLRKADGSERCFYHSSPGPRRSSSAWPALRRASRGRSAWWAP